MLEISYWRGFQPILFNYLSPYHATTKRLIPLQKSSAIFSSSKNDYVL